jgi:cell division protein FtsB
MLPKVGWLTVVLAVLLLLVQLDLWLGRGRQPHQWRLEQELAAQRELNAQARQRNDQLAAEVADLRDGLEIVEERARTELGMIRPNEILVQVSGGR